LDYFILNSFRLKFDLLIIDIQSSRCFPIIGKLRIFKILIILLK